MKYPVISYKDDLLIKPYIIAPIPDKQDQLILADSKNFRKHNHFINSLKRGSEINRIKSPFARAFKQGNYLNIYLTFPTDRTEKSGRSGLLLTLGALVHKSILSKFSVCFDFMAFYTTLFNYLFELDLSKNGASNFLQKLETKENYEQLSKRIEELYIDLKRFFPQKKPSPFIRLINFSSELFKRPTIKKKIVKKIIVGENNPEQVTEILSFFQAIDYMVGSNGSHKIDYKTANGDHKENILIDSCPPSIFYEHACNLNLILDVNYEKKIILLR